MKYILITFLLFSIFVQGYAQAYMADDRSHLPPLAKGMAISDLDGIWEINLSPEKDFASDIIPGSAWKSLQVPGEPSMQGFTIKNDMPFVYRKKIQIPARAEDKKNIIRFNGVYSQAKVYINGKFVREHFGGFTSWDCDITAFINEGQENWLHVEVTDRTDDISYASGYAHHPLGGILRSVQLIILPVNHVQYLYADATTDQNYKTGILNLNLAASQPAKGLSIEYMLVDLSGIDVWETPRKSSLNGKGELIGKIKIEAVKKWTAETPHLYILKLHLLQNKKRLQTIEQHIGFRKVEIDVKNRLLVNGNPVKLRGACRHDMHPLLGRSTNRKQDSLDVLLAKESNMNFIRTSHYPPSKDFLEFCDRYGIYVQEETAICFVIDWREGVYKKYGETQNDTAFTGRYLGQLSEMIDRDRNFASVIMWSIGNESNYGSNFQKEYDFVKLVDLTRPVAWSWPNTALEKGKRCFDIAISHYPNYNGIGSDMGGIEKRMIHPDFPVLGDEWAHVSCYNTDMLAYDPNVKDFWGKSLDTMWMARFDVEGNIGGAIWGMIDETFHLADTVTGYGPWGIVDVWRRKKPEFWNTKKAYSPIRLDISQIKDLLNGYIQIPVRNRFDHLNLNEIKAFITIDGISTPLILPSVAPHASALLEVPFSGKATLVQFRDVHNNLIDEEMIKGNTLPSPILAKMGKWEINDNPGLTVLTNNDLKIEINHKTGLINKAIFKGNVMLENGPEFTVNLPKNPESLKITGSVFSGNFKADTFYITRSDSSIFEYSTNGYTDHYPVTLITSIYPDGTIETKYTADSIPDYTWEIGMKFPVNKSFNTIEWERKGYWSTYPDQHLSSLKGKASRYVEYKEAYRTKPAIGVEQTMYDYYLNKTINKESAAMEATEIYRAKKENILHFATYQSQYSGSSIKVLPGGNQSVKMSVEKDNEQFLLVADKWDYWGLSWGNFQGIKNKSKQFSGTITIKIGGL